MTSESILPLQLEEVNFEYRHKRLIKDFSCSFEQGLRTIVIGPNGAGKSLLLRLCHGLLQPTSGQVLWQGGTGADVARHQGMVFQRPVMLRRSARSNVDYALSVRGVPRQTRNTIIDEVLQRTGLSRFAGAPARQLSFGEQQRLALARVWALQPQILFLDEPTASLDPPATYLVEEILKAIHDAGTRIVMTTHDVGQARRLADDVMFLHRGRLLEHAPAAQFFEEPQNDLAQAFVRGELLWWHRKHPLHKPGQEEEFAE